MHFKRQTAVLISGGLDSAILVSRLLTKKLVVQPVYFQSGHVWEKAELYWLKRFLKSIRTHCLKPLEVLSCSTDDLYKTHWSMTGKKIPGAKSSDLKVYLPGKNLLLITKAAVYCSLNKISVLALGPLGTNPFPDARASFFKNLERVCSEGLNFKLRIRTPFLERNKNEVVKLGKKLPLHLTFSCLNPHPPLSPGKKDGVREYIHCGQCNKCAERKKAFRNARIPDLTPYAH